MKGKSTGTTCIILILICLIGGTYLISCNKKGTSLQGNTLFSIRLGTLPDELDWFYRDGFKVAATADIQSRGNRVYISGGESGKIMVFRTNGELETLVYDPSRASAPSQISEQIETSVARSFQTLGHIAVTNSGFLVEESVENTGNSQDSEESRYNRIILRFNLDGTFLGHLGREGIGGSPFPHIEELDVRDDGVIVVSCRVMTGWILYWYNSEGSPLLTIRIADDQLPSAGEGTRSIVYSIRPDPSEWTAHIRMDVYKAGQEESDPEARLYTFDLNSREYREPVIIDYDFGNNDVLDVPPDYLGTISSGVHVLLRPEGPDTYRLLLINREGRIVQNRRLNINATDNIYRRFRLRSSGELTGIFMGPEEAVISQWSLGIVG